MQLIEPSARDLGGGLRVRRILPSAQQQAVGPFLFFDHFGPLEIAPAADVDVRPHPHIGLATVTYLFDGAMLHRDSTGVVQTIEPGAINWMTAGRGIVHSERAPDDQRGRARRLHGLQLWAALPPADEDGAPSFSHTPAAAIPEVERNGSRVRVLIGAAYGVQSPVPTRSDTLYLDITLAAGQALDLPAALARERAFYPLDAEVAIDGTVVPAKTLAVLDPGAAVRLQAAGATRVVVIGGESLGHRHIWWNFVSSRKELIVQAAKDWAAQPNARFARVPGEVEFIPLPDKHPL